MVWDLGIHGFDLSTWAQLLHVGCTFVSKYELRRNIQRKRDFGGGISEIQTIFYKINITSHLPFQILRTTCGEESILVDNLKTAIKHFTRVTYQKGREWANKSK